MTNQFLRTLAFLRYGTTEIEIKEEKKMTVHEWVKENNDVSFTCVWAADSNAGFGNKGDTAYGDHDGYDVIKVEWSKVDYCGEEIKRAKLHIWPTRVFGECPKEALA